MSIKLGIIMDPMDTIKPYKDTTFALMLEAQRRQWTVYTMQQADVFFTGSDVYAQVQAIRVQDNTTQWYALEAQAEINLKTCDVILMRKDPPFDQEYIYTTYFLDHLSANGVLVVNHPRALRDLNEKFATTFFPQFCPETLFSRDIKRLKQFCLQHKRVVCKPLDAMGGQEVFILDHQDPNLNVSIETLSHNGQRTLTVQRYIPEITAGDKRILLINGQAVEKVLVRIPQGDEFRGNLARGAKAERGTFTERDRAICKQVAPRLLEMGILFAGIDIIGDYLTEINVTSPTGIREIDTLYESNLAALVLDAMTSRLVNDSSG